MQRLIKRWNLWGHYELQMRKGWLCDCWRHLLGQSTKLAEFGEIVRYSGAHEPLSRQLEYVPLSLILGSEGEAQGFTPDFLPRTGRDRARWMEIDAALRAGTQFQPVELYRIGDAYFVHDGHYRISVASANGFGGVEAYVTEMKSALPLTAELFRQRNWWKKVEQIAIQA